MGEAADPKQLAARVAELEAENDLLWDDLARLLAERNALGEVAAEYAHPGPDGQDYMERRELVAEWLDEARERVADDPAVKVRPVWLVPETQAMRNLTRKELRVRLRRSLRMVRDAKQRTATVAAQRDHARRAIARMHELLTAGDEAAATETLAAEITDNEAST